MRTRLNLRKAQNIRFDQDTHRILFDIAGATHRAHYSSLLRTFFIEGTETFYNMKEGHEHFPGLVVKRVGDHFEITIAPKLEPVTEAPYTYERDDIGHCTIMFRGKIQPFGATFYGEESDILSFVVKGVNALNKAHQNGESSVVIERPKREPVVIYIDRETGRL